MDTSSLLLEVLEETLKPLGHWPLNSWVMFYIGSDPGLPPDRWRCNGTIVLRLVLSQEYLQIIGKTLT